MRPGITKLFNKPDDAGGNPDPTMKPKGGHPGESVKPPQGGEDISPAGGDRVPGPSQEQIKKDGGTQTR